MDLLTIQTALRSYLHKQKFDINEAEWNRSAELMSVRCKAIIGRSMFGDGVYFKVINPTDARIRAARNAIRDFDVEEAIPLP